MIFSKVSGWKKLMKNIGKKKMTEKLKVFDNYSWRQMWAWIHCFLRELEQYLWKTFSYRHRCTPITIPADLPPIPPPENQMNTRPTWNEVENTMQQARSASATGTSGIPYRRIQANSLRHYCGGVFVCVRAKTIFLKFVFLSSFHFWRWCQGKEVA